MHTYLCRYSITGTVSTTIQKSYHILQVIINYSKAQYTMQAAMMIRTLRSMMVFFNLLLAINLISTSDAFTGTSIGTTLMGIRHPCISGTNDNNNNNNKNGPYSHSHSLAQSLAHSLLAHASVLFMNPKIKSDLPKTSSEVGKLDVLPSDIYIRCAEAKDLKIASKILTDAFFSFNILSTLLEWLKTYFSLCDSLSETNDHYYMFVACNSDSVIGICEVDDRPSSKTKTITTTPRPCIFNLAVDEKWRQKGIGKALMNVCEEKARNEWKEDFLYLRVRNCNKSAINFYLRLGYIIIEEFLQPPDKISGDEIILMKKTL
mmetsp:Transcript_21876/g.25278  ORF Transcript_21876/g.25278 Transcript_21876/m.25278 type:complete len:318 (-) Transcript_21876:729-1682(-)